MFRKIAAERAVFFFSYNQLDSSFPLLCLGICIVKELIYFRHSFKGLQWDIFIAKINKNSVTFFEAILRNEVTY